MNLLDGLARRLGGVDAQQYLVLYLAAMLVALLGSWPAGPAGPNDAWFALAYTRAAALAALGLGYGMSAAADSARERRTVLLMLQLFAMLALPIEIAAYAASFPVTPLWWLVLLPPLTGPAYMGIGLLIGRLLTRARLVALSPVVVVLVLAGMVSLDVYLGVNVFNPFTAAVRVSVPHLVFIAAGLAATLFAVRVARPPAVGTGGPA